ncbi:hydroxysqualene dehydroxylase HpnE [Pseudorhodoferax soli]|uniref:Squalene-associated FAD-dependent desaturase n=1 Tax=Pseudorhodoferax soli TaxID=545864 RepID=A0A368XA24_9BURK|nr:hydroxysqualene dehydroxylase HpnE [Pseudorhodoferax soli]RCW64813.1 squalene-associated FAD-dependent desaturase [Pseudorhodoferax soli]
MNLAIVGAGWAGLAAAVGATEAGHQVTVLEAARHAGGRARSVVHAHAGRSLTLDNGQHILIGAYTETLALMRAVGVDPAQALLRLPLDLRLPDGEGIALPDRAPPWDALAGILGARGWGWRDKAALLAATTRWQLAGFRCAPQTTVAQLCAGLPARVLQAFVEPLCLSALNTAASEASASVFLRVLRDSLLGGRGGSNMLIPRRPLGALFPEPAIAWLQAQGQSVQMGMRVNALARDGAQWRVDGQPFDRVLLACPSWEAARLVRTAGCAADTWLARADALQFEPITTVYATSATRLPRPMAALKGTPAQFVFDRRHLGEDGLLAFVVSVSRGTREELQQQVIAQGRAELGLADLQPVVTIVEKRATFACTPALERPGLQIAPGLSACGEYVAGPYPGTIEGAVRSARDALAGLS